MSAIFPTLSLVSSCRFNEFKVCSFKSKRNISLNSYLYFVCCKLPWINIQTSSGNDPCCVLKSTSLKCVKPTYESFIEENNIPFDWKNEEGDSEEMDSPWEGAIVYKRNSSESHMEYCTTLERLGLEKLSTDVSKCRASTMGLRVTKSVKDYPFGTPVHISIDVTRKEEKLRLDGIIKTVITLDCYRCCEPAAECVFSNFSLILSEKPIEEPEIINICGSVEDSELIDLDDQLYFPLIEKEIDISKNIRDTVHLEITMNALCDQGCKGMCLKCGTNLNTRSCNCSKQEVKKNVFGPLGNLKRQM